MPDHGHLLPRVPTLRRVMVNSTAHWDASLLACVRYQHEETKKEVGRLREIISDQRDHLDDINKSVENLRDMASEQSNELNAATSQLDITEEVRPSYSVLGIYRRLLASEERLDSVISKTATVSHEAVILRTAMEQMAKDLKKIARVTGIVTGMATAATVHFYIW
jgi:methyl-accepting chemotaxis protein